MARYREKDETDLAWNRIRRRVTRELDIAIADAREEALNALLAKAWDDFVKAIGDGTVPEVESRYSEFAASIVKDIVTPKVIAAASPSD